MALTAGTRLGPYEIHSLLGAGGMGEVYRAHDSRLRRDVAIKILPGGALEGSDGALRFEREAQATAALSHPNICPVFDVGSCDGTQFIVSELLRGTTLREVLAGGALPPRQVITYAADISRGLAAAHEKGIVHRDLKPENVFVTEDGQIKILDFGIARLMEDIGSDEATHLSPTNLTDGGRVVGTVGYMSPEQIRSQATDGRSDIFSLGTVMFEMLSGIQPFRGDTAADTTSAILREDPAPFEISRVPPVLERIVRRCLEKTPKRRFQSAEDLAFALDAITSTTTVTGLNDPQPTARRPFVRAWPVVSAAVASVLLTAYAMNLGTEERYDFQYVPFATDAESEGNAAWSADGRNVAYAKTVDRHEQIFIRSLDSDSAIQLTHGTTNATWPMWWPDGNRVGYVADRRIWSINRAGGEPELIQTGPVTAVSLSPDGQTLAMWSAVQESGHVMASVWIASPPRAKPRKYTPSPFESKGDLNPQFLAFSPDGRQLLLSTINDSFKVSIWILPFPDASNAQPRLRALKAPDQGLPPQFSWMPDNRRAVATLRTNAAGRRGLWMVDTRTGKVSPISLGLQTHSSPNVSPDGTRIVFTTGGPDYDLIQVPLDGSLPRDVLATASSEVGAAWVPGSSSFVYVTNRGGSREIHLRSGTENADRLIVAASKIFPDKALDLPVVSPDGQRVAFHVWGVGGVATIWISSVQGGAPARVSPDGSEDLAPEWSPDGRQLACLHYDAGVLRLAVLQVGTGQAPRILTPTGPDIDGVPAWSPDGHWVAFIQKGEVRLVSPDGTAQRTLAAVPIDAVVWSRDSATLYTVRTADTGSLEVVELDASSGQIRTTHRINGADFDFEAPLAPGQRFTLAADGKSFLASVVRYRTDLWMLDDFSTKSSWLDWFWKGR